MDDHRHQQEAQHLENKNLYSNRQSPMKLSIGTTPVCAACSCCYYAITKDVLYQLKVCVRKGELKYVDKRKNYASNQFHSNQSLCRALSAVDKYFDEQKKLMQEMPDSSRTIHKDKPTHVLPVTLAKNAIWNRYFDYCKADSYEEICYTRFIKLWKTKHA